MPWRKGNRLRVVPEDQARGRTAEILAEFRETIGVPNVTVFLEALCAYPAFLDLHWRAIRRVAETREFFQLGECLRADCYTRMHGYFNIPDLSGCADSLARTSEPRLSLTEVIETAHYRDSLLLLIMAAQLQALDSPVGENSIGTRPALHPAFETANAAPAEQSGSGVSQRLLDELKRTLQLSFVPTFYTEISHCADFLQAYWTALKPVLASPVYEGCHYGVRECSLSLVTEFPERVELSITQLAEAGIPENDITSLARMLEAFVNTLSATVLNIAFAKIALEGGTAYVRGASGKRGNEQEKSEEAA